jgi:predicted DNA-binding transcriptional regulator AlpA
MENDEELVDDAPDTDDGAADKLTESVSSEIVMSLAKYNDADYITKIGLAKAFGCSERTLQRMVERLELPPPMLLAGKKVWIVGKLRAWIRSAAERQEEEALRGIGLFRAFDD